MCISESWIKHGELGPLYETSATLGRRSPKSCSPWLLPPLYKKCINISHSSCFNPFAKCQYSALKKSGQACSPTGLNRAAPTSVCRSYNALLNTFINSGRVFLPKCCPGKEWAGIGPAAGSRRALSSNRFYSRQRKVMQRVQSLISEVVTFLCSGQWSCTSAKHVGETAKGPSQQKTPL